jgi:hypothetical protein
MRYITRQLYQSMQGGSGLPPGELTRRWNQACEACETELSTITPRLPPSMRSFSKVTLHDGVVNSAGRPRANCVELRVDASNNPWGPRGWFRVEFKGVQEVEGLANIIGDDWLYEEVHLHPSAGFEYCVLLWHSEFRVVADEVVFEPVDASND